MDPATIITLVGFAIREAPEVLALIVAMMKLFGVSLPTADGIDREGLKFFAYLQKHALDVAHTVDNLDFGQPTEEGQKASRFNEVVKMVKDAARALGRELETGKAETVAQNGYAMMRAGMPPSEGVMPSSRSVTKSG